MGKTMMAHIKVPKPCQEENEEEQKYHLNISGQDKPTIWWKPCCADRDGYEGQMVERISFHLTARQEAVN